ncbi:MAG: hypothetical protein O2795_11535 [Acidobacteria bacterium]|nr:hypothetical protein [Acidobacteriota bacterium]
MRQILGRSASAWRLDWPHRSPSIGYSKPQLRQASPNHPIRFAVTSSVLILAAFLGILIPARRASRVDPLSALRHD